MAIAAAEGPVLITAGPGTGKTYTLVQRAIYLIEECGVKPESIFIATFTEKAAKELITRITNELSERGIVANINEMYIGTFHSLCLRILKEHLEYTRLRRNYRLLDAFDQQYMVFQNIHRFRNIPEVEIALPNGGAWKQSETICNYVNNLSEELVTPEELMADSDLSIAALGRMLKEYRDILIEGNLMDFSSIQIEAYHLLYDHTDILEEMRSKVTHIMVDEYQDTNFIQEQLVFLLAGNRKNICVVGDDDQGLYRFRGATIRNILEFPQKFADGECRIIPLVINYRSNSDIVDFYNKWMATTDGAKFKFRWENFRYDKKIEPHEKTDLHTPAVVKLAGVDDTDEWHEKILRFITDLKTSGKLTNYNQIAFLFNSVKHPRVTALARFLEENHINVYSPRSDMFFQRDEIRLAIGCLMLMFPHYVQGLENFYRFYDEIDEELKHDEELVNLFRGQLTDTCYPDPELRTLTFDVGFYISRYFSQSQKGKAEDDDDEFDENDPNLFSDEWFPALADYSPGFTKEQWLDLLNNKKIIGPIWGGVLAAFYEAGGASTCTQIALKYNKNASGISGNCTQLAKRISECLFKVINNANL